MIKICKRFNPNCLLLTCCSKRCQDFNTYVISNIRHLVYHENICAYCGHTSVEYSIMKIRPNFFSPLKIYLFCLDCGSLMILYFPIIFNGDVVGASYDDRILSKEELDVEHLFNFERETRKYMYTEDTIENAIKDLDKQLDEMESQYKEGAV